MLFLPVFTPGLCVAGLVLVICIKPGVGRDDGKVATDDGDDDEAFSTVDALLDLIRWEEVFGQPVLTLTSTDFSTCLPFSFHFRSVANISQNAAQNHLFSFKFASIRVFLSRNNVCEVLFKVKETSGKDSHHVLDSLLFLFRFVNIYKLINIFTHQFHDGGCVWFFFPLRRNMVPQNLLLVGFQQVCFITQACDMWPVTETM